MRLSKTQSSGHCLYKSLLETGGRGANLVFNLGRGWELIFKDLEMRVDIKWKIGGSEFFFESYFKNYFLIWIFKKNVLSKS